MKKRLNLLSSYVPRHFRLGVCSDSPVLELFQDVVESVPVVRDDGVVVSEHLLLKSVPAAVVMSKFKMSAFRLSALLESGVPLKMVNINGSTSMTIEQLNDICQSIDGVEKFYAKVEAEKAARRSWFEDDDSTVDLSSSSSGDQNV